MLESGRARTFNQQSTPDVREAVASCPVSCMHPVSYRELKEYEIARDEGDGRTDHKHLKNWQGHTPLYVAGIDSDNNHKSSWYHTMKGKCVGKYSTVMYEGKKREIYISICIIFLNFLFSSSLFFSSFGTFIIILFLPRHRINAVPTKGMLRLSKI